MYALFHSQLTSLRQYTILRPIYFVFAAAFTLVLLFFTFTPSTYAEGMTRTATGCHEREATETSATETAVTMWMQSPTCTITIQNTSEADQSTTVTLNNLDPFYYIVTDSNDITYTQTTTSTTTTFSALTLSGTTTTITVEPWSTNATASAAYDGSFSFVAVSDPQSHVTGDPNPVFTTILNRIDESDVPFVLLPGDLIKGSSSNASTHETFYDNYESALANYPGLVAATPGDHDALNDLDEHFSARFGDRFYSFTYEDTAFVLINSVETYAEEGTFSEDDLATVESLLSAAQEAESNHIVVAMHHPLVPPSWANSPGIAEDARLELANLFGEYGVDLIVSGDVHGYDSASITGDDIDGFEGSINQLIVGGGGGTMTTYEGDNFYTVVHVTADAITHTKVDYEDAEMDIDYSAANDGTQQELTITLSDDGNDYTPYVRVPFHVLGYNMSVYTETGAYLAPVTYEDATTTRGYVELDSSYFEETDSATLTVKQQTTALTGLTNTINEEGIITFAEDALPTAENTATELSITAVDAAATVTISAWDMSDQTRTWTETTASKAETTYTISGLDPYRVYDLYMNGNLKRRATADTDGSATIAVKSRVTNRTYELRPRAIAHTSIGVLPGTEGGGQYRAFTNKGKALTAFSAYSDTSDIGYNSTRCDCTGNQKIELVTLTGEGAPAELRVFNANAKQLDSIYPFGFNYTGGGRITAGDVDGDGIDEIVVVPGEGTTARVRVYQMTDGELELLKGVRPYNKKYKGGLAVTVADIDADGDQEIIVGALTDKKQLRVYRWLPQKQKLRQWFSHAPFGGANAGTGFELTAADINFDGDDEVIVGTVSGNGRVNILSPQPKKKRFKQLARFHAQPTSYEGGVRLLAGNTDSSNYAEVVAIPRTGNQNNRVFIYSYTKGKKKMKRAVSIKAFSDAGDEGVTAALFDPNIVGKNQIAVGKVNAGGLVRVYRRKGSSSTVRVKSFKPYGSSYTGGISFTQ